MNVSRIDEKNDTTFFCVEGLRVRGLGLGVRVYGVGLRVEG